MSGKRYPEEFKIEAVKQVTERGHAATEVAVRLGVSSHSLYQWVKRYSAPPAERQKVSHHLFDTLDEIQDFATRRLWTFNHDRPNMALGGITPKQKFALTA